MDGEASPILKLSTPVKKLQNLDSTIEGESSGLIKLKTPLKNFGDDFSTMVCDNSPILKLSTPLQKLDYQESTIESESSGLIKLKTPLKRFGDDYSTIVCDSSPILKLSTPLQKLEPPLKKAKILDSTISANSDDILGNIHPSNKDNTDYLDLSISSPGSPLDRSTPISDYDMAETEVESVSDSPVKTVTFNKSGSKPMEVEEQDPGHQVKPVKPTSRPFVKSPPPPRNCL